MRKSQIYTLLILLLIIAIPIIDKLNLSQRIIKRIQHQTKTIDDLVITRDSTLPLSKNINTSYLPLHLEYIDLASNGFPAIGGHIERFKNGLLLMSRSGDFFTFNMKRGLLSEKISVNNNLDNYISDNGIPRSNTMRALSFVYNCEDKKLYAIYLRYHGLKKGSVSISSTKFNCNSSSPFLSNDWEDLYSSKVVDISYLRAAHAAGGVLHKMRKTYISLLVGALNKSFEQGKVIRLPKNSSKGEGEIYSIGHRNLQDMIRSSDGSLLAIEHGPQGGDELNKIKNDANYGWPVKTFGTKYGTFDHYYDFKVPHSKLTGIFSEPLFSFVPSIATSTLLQVKYFHKRWLDNILIGSLKSQSLYRLKLDTSHNRVLFVEPIFIGHRIRSVAEVDSAIYLLTDDSYLIKVTTNLEKLSRNKTTDDLYSKHKLLSKCTKCHGFSETNPSSVAPSLKGVFRRRIASSNFSGYSKGLKAIDGVWNREKLMKYLKKPQGFSPGTMMPPVDLSDNEIEEIIDILEKY